MRLTVVIYGVILGFTLFIASQFPITNDEAYYIAFAKNLQLSYVDAPPFVAYLTFFQQQFGWSHPLMLRGLVILIHLLSTGFLLLIVKQHLKTDPDLQKKLLMTFSIAYIVPIFGLVGIFILPDCGLIFSLSVMLWVADTVNRRAAIRLRDSLLLGVGLGIGLLSKYHILPLGGGMLLGLYVAHVSHTNRFSPLVLLKLLLSVCIGCLIAMPLWIWNYQNHYASFVFQLQHGFQSNHWRIGSLLAFIAGVLLYMTPWFSYVLLKEGLLKQKKWYLVIPFSAIFFILLISSLRKPSLPHWLTPAFWILIPYAVIQTKQACQLQRMCRYTAIIWLGLVMLLLSPQGIYTIKSVSQRFYPDTSYLADLLLWGDLKRYIQHDPLIQKKLAELAPCHGNPPLIGTIRWYWAAQLAYQQMFPASYKILNLDQHSSNFYLWRDSLKAYANCPLFIIANKNMVQSDLSDIVTIKNSQELIGIDSYRSVHLMLISGTLKSAAALDAMQQSLLLHPRY